MAAATLRLKTSVFLFLALFAIDIVAQSLAYVDAEGSTYIGVVSSFTSPPALYPDVISGELQEPLQDSLGCQTATDASLQGKIALLGRGNCSFLDKVRRKSTAMLLSF